jgi:hypothetical protein
MKPDTEVVFTVNIDAAAFRQSIRERTPFRVEAFTGSCPPSDEAGGKWSATILVPINMVWEMHRIPGRGDERFQKPPADLVAEVEARVQMLIERKVSE